MNVTVMRSAVIDAPIDRVWAVLRDFGGVSRWHPSVTAARMENESDGDVVGGVRRLALTDGAELREQLLLHSDRDTTLTYGVLDASLALNDCVTSIRLRPVTDGRRTFWCWRARFRTPADQAAALEARIGEALFEAGFAGLRRILAESVDAPAASAETEAVDAAATTGARLPTRTDAVARTGEPKVLSVLQTTVPPPEAGRVRLRQTAVAVNRIDLDHARGRPEGLPLPEIPGIEGVGEIIDVGEAVGGLFPGDRVAYLDRRPGAYADVRCVDADSCILLPDTIVDTHAAALLKGVTAALLLNRVFRAAAESTILIEAVGRGVGHLIAQWARSMRLVVAGTVASDEEARFSRQYGCDYPILAGDAAALEKTVMRVTNGRGVDYWVHRNGARGLETAIECLAHGGHLAVIANPDATAMPLDVNRLRQRALTVSAPSIDAALRNRLQLQRFAHQFFARVHGGAITPVVDTLPLDQAAEAHRRISAGESLGIVALIP